MHDAGGVLHVKLLEQVNGLHEEISAGGVVYRTGARGVELLVIRDRFGYWTLPKGKVHPGEEPPRAALREIAEETGITGEIRGTLGIASYVYRDARSREVAKTVTYYLVDARGGDARPNPGEVAAACWCSPEEALARSGYPSDRPILAEACRRLAMGRP